MPSPAPKHPLACGLVVAALLAPGAAMAAPYADLAAIDRAVAAFTGVDIGLPGGASLPVDRRLRLGECASPLALSWRGNRHDVVVVECPDTGSWHLYVPVHPQTIQATQRAVDRGDAVTIAVVGEDFSVLQPGEALEPGAVGDWINVRAMKDGTAQSSAIRARITRPGEVEIPSP